MKRRFVETRPRLPVSRAILLGHPSASADILGSLELCGPGGGGSVTSLDVGHTPGAAFSPVGGRSPPMHARSAVNRPDGGIASPVFLSAPQKEGSRPSVGTARLFNSACRGVPRAAILKAVPVPHGNLDGGRVETICGCG